MSCIHQLCQKSCYISIRAQYTSWREFCREFSHTLLLQAQPVGTYTLNCSLEIYPPYLENP